jgi:hypothetical protein
MEQNVPDQQVQQQREQQRYQRSQQQRQKQNAAAGLLDPFSGAGQESQTRSMQQQRHSLPSFAAARTPAHASSSTGPYGALYTTAAGAGGSSIPSTSPVVRKSGSAAKWLNLVWEFS